MFSYFAYGLGIQSELAIPEFIEAQMGCDVTLHIEREGSADGSYRTHNDYVPKEVVEQAPWGLQLNREEALLYLRDTGVFLVKGGNKIVIIPAAGASEQMIRFYLVGTIMAIVLYQRGLLVLHGSAVNINGGAVAFLGVSGQGKSSTAAAFNAHGYSVLTDDVAAVTLGQGAATITPGFPQIKLGQEIAGSLGHDFDLLQRLHPSELKRGYRVAQEFLKTPLPIRRLYVLADDSEFSIEPVSPQESVMELVQHSRPTTLLHTGDALHFMQCANLVKECGVYRLKRPRNLALLPNLVKLVEEHIARDVHKAMVF